MGSRLNGAGFNEKQSRSSTYPRRGSRTSLVSNQEIRRAMRGDSPQAFGIRRVLGRESEDEITNLTFGMWGENKDADIPEKVILRDSLSVTLLSQKVIGRQLARGVIAGYNLGRTSALVERSEACSERRESLEVGIGDVRIFQGRILYAAILSEEINEEIDAIHAILGSVGLKGIAKTEKPFVPHLTLGDVGPGERLSHVEQKHIKEKLEVGLPQTAFVQPWDVYPHDILSSGRH